MITEELRTILCHFPQGQLIVSLTIHKSSRFNTLTN